MGAKRKKAKLMEAKRMGAKRMGAKRMEVKTPVLTALHSIAYQCQELENWRIFLSLNS